MNRISSKLNLLNLHAVVKMIPGKLGPVECLVIPIEKNKLFKGEKGIYLDLIGFPIEKPKEGSKDTHLIKQSFSKEVREMMSEEELKSTPIIGNHQVWSDNFTSEPISSASVLNEDDDLPY